MHTRSIRRLALLGAVLTALRPRRPPNPSHRLGPDPLAEGLPVRLVWPIALAVLALALAATAGVMVWRAVQAQAKVAAVAKAITRGDPARAPELITRYGCGGCHAIPGVAGADGRVAGPLGGLRERVYVGGVARNNADTLIRWIVSPQSLSPRSAMPATGISEAEARDVAAYLYAH